MLKSFELCFSFRQQQHGHDIKISEAYNELKIKTAEAQQTQILYDETIRNLQESQKSAEKTQKKLEVRIFSDFLLYVARHRRATQFISCTDCTLTVGRPYTDCTLAVRRLYTDCTLTVRRLYTDCMKTTLTVH